MALTPGVKAGLPKDRGEWGDQGGLQVIPSLEPGPLVRLTPSLAASFCGQHPQARTGVFPSEPSQYPHCPLESGSAITHSTDPSPLVATAYLPISFIIAFCFVLHVFPESCKVPRAGHLMHVLNSPHPRLCLAHYRCRADSVNKWARKRMNGARTRCMCVCVCDLLHGWKAADSWPVRADNVTTAGRRQSDTGRC